ncbi:hypothetical protein BOTBODRAFT_31492 [Botryobasidium botryosum FD-172 SS1]|uniref:Ubiquitin-like domain-containing protein n=1 Tax=Botryobasidium botryosum (strain FD-172 SS1) TaxID=930990 RepID=A0A067MLI9_BOTB1|nr:hypothetical protein BOTBODRAFT_31492 [Botryobasidium botryosum FD-172 SS1]
MSVATNGSAQHATPTKKPPPAGPAPPAPSSNSQSPALTNAVPRPTAAHPPNGTAPSVGYASKGKKKVEPPDPVTMYESVRSRIAALEEEEVLGEEEDRKIAEEARKSVKSVSDSAIQSKYIELFQEMKRLERDHAKEKQKLTKDKDSAKTQLNKANQSRTKLENLARELQKDNKKLREDSRRLAMNVEEAQDEISAMKSEMERRLERSSHRHGKKPSDSADIVVKVVCRYRAELFFKISRKTKLSRLFNAWTDRMESAGSGGGAGEKAKSKEAGSNNPGAAGGKSGMAFIFTYLGRNAEAEQTPEELGIEDGDEILAVEMMDLTKDAEEVPEVQQQRLKKNWADNSQDAKKALEEIFDGVVRERLKDVLRQYELREKHFDCVIRSKELEVLLSRARAEEQKQLAEGERQIATVAETQNQQLRQQMEEMQVSQARLMDKLIACCKEPTGERTQRLFAFLREELEKRGTKMADGPVGG